MAGGDNVAFRLFSKMLHTTPRLAMITNYPRKRSSDHQLRKFLFSISTIEYDRIFVECGFPPDDGKRKFLPHEADDKAAFHSDRLWEKLGTSKRWLKDSIDPNVFLEHYDICIDVLTCLCFLEKYLKFHAPSPSKQLAELKQRRSEIEIDMISRAWDAELRKVSKLSTVKSKVAHLSKFFNVFSSVKEEFSTAAATKIAEISQQAESINLDNLAVAPKAPPVFDTVKEQALLSAYCAAENEKKRHFARNDLIAFYYKYRHDKTLLEKCRALCVEDISNLPLLDQITRQEVTVAYQNTCRYFTPTKQQTADYERRMKCGFVAKIPAFDKIIMLHLNAGEYSEALEWCDKAIAYEKEHSYQKRIDSEYKTKKERIKKKLEKSTNTHRLS